MAWKFGNIGEANERINELESQLTAAQAQLRELQDAATNASANADAVDAKLKEQAAEIERLTAEAGKIVSIGDALKAAEAKAAEAEAKAKAAESAASRKAAEIVAGQGVPPIPSEAQEKAGKPKSELTGLARAIEAHRTAKK